jgi:hypothetical protein
MLIQNQVGPIAAATSLTTGTQVPGRAGQLGDFITSKLNPDYYEATYRRLGFNAANQAGIVTTIGLALTYTGLMISNPPGSSVNVVPTFVGYAFPVAPAADIVVGLMCGFNAGTACTHTAAGVVHSNYWGVGSIGQALVDTSGAFPTAPFLAKVLGKVDTGAITTETQVAPSLTDLKGSIILPPGAYMGFYTSTVSNTAGAFFSIDWLEIPV